MNKNNIFHINKRGINEKYSHPSTPHISKSPLRLRKSRTNIKERRNGRSFEHAVSKFYSGSQRVNQSQNIRPLFKHQQHEQQNNYRSVSGREIMQKMMMEAKMKRLEEIEKNRAKLMQVEALRKKAEERVEYHKMLKQREEEKLRSKSHQIRQRSNRVRPWRDNNKNNEAEKEKMRPRSHNKLKPMNNIVVMGPIKEEEKEKTEEPTQKYKTLKIKKRSGKSRDSRSESEILNHLHKENQDKLLVNPTNERNVIRRFSTFKSKTQNPSLKADEENKKLLEAKKITSLPLTSDENKGEGEKIKTPPSEGQSYMSHAQSPQVYPQSHEFFKKKKMPKIQTDLERNIKNSDKEKMKKAMHEVQKMINLNGNEDQKKIDKQNVQFFLSKKKHKNKKNEENFSKENKVKKKIDQIIVEANQEGSYLQQYKRKVNKSHRKVKPVKRKKNKRKVDEVNNIIIKESYVHPPSDTNSKKKELEEIKEEIVSNNLVGQEKSQENKQNKYDLSLAEFENLEKEARKGNETPTFENLDKFKKSQDKIDLEDGEQKEAKNEILENESKPKEEVIVEKIEKKVEKKEEKISLDETENIKLPDEEEEAEEDIEDPFEKEEKSESEEIEDPFGDQDLNNSQKSDEVEDPFGSTKKSLSVDENELAKSTNSDIKLDLNLNEEDPEGKHKVNEINQTPLNSTGHKTPELELDLKKTDFIKKEAPVDIKRTQNTRKIDISKKARKPMMTMGRPTANVTSTLKKPAIIPKKKDPIHESIDVIEDGDNDKINRIFVDEDSDDF